MAPNNAKLAQSYQMPLGRVAGGPGNVALTQNLQRSSIMGAVQVACTDPNAEITDITLSGQSLWVSSNPFGVLGWAGTASGSTSRYIGVPLESQSQISLQTTLSAAGAIGASITTDPVYDDAPIASIDEFGPMLNYCGGLFPAGGTNVPALGTAIVNTIIRRDVVMGRLVIYANAFLAPFAPAAVGTCTVDAISVNNLALQSGPANTPSPVESFSPQAFDANGGNTLFYPVETNSIVSITVTNNSAVAQVFFGGFWCLPPV